MAVDLSFFRSETSMRLRAEGRAEGEAVGQAKSILRVLDLRGVEPTAEQRERVASCTDEEALDVWLARALSASSADEVFAE